MSSMPSTPTPTVSFKGSSISLDDFPLHSSTIADLNNLLWELTTVPPDAQKLLWKGKKTGASSDTTLQDAGLKPGSKILLLGTTAAELSDFKQAESDASRRQAILQQRAASSSSKVRSTTTRQSAKYGFSGIAPLPHLPNPEQARKLLDKLANDPAIQHVMVKHQFTVGLLTELAPHEHPNLLGLNENRGQTIKLRVRTDAYDGFRQYSEVRRVLLHELAHNIWGPHDDNFKNMNSLLNKEVAQYEATVKAGTHTLIDTASVYPGSAASLQENFVGGMIGGTNILGGESTAPSTAEERRALMVQAAMRRFEEEESEIEDRCAT